MDDRMHLRRDRAEYMAGALSGIAFVVLAWMRLAVASGPADVVAGIGFLALTAGIVGALVMLHRRRRTIRAASERSEALRRERDLLRSARWWYLGPMVPGFLLVLGAGIVSRPATGLVVLAVVGAFLVWVDRQNRQAARAVERELAAEQGRG